MGSLSFRAVNRLLARPDFARRVFGDVSFRPPGVTAMKFVRDPATREWVFAGEVPVGFSVALREQAFCDAAGRLHVGRWARVEVQVDHKGSEIRPGWFLTASAYPTSLATTLHVTFKKSSRKKRKPSMQPFPGVFDSVEALADAIESLGQDFWEKGAYLTAGFPLPLLGKPQAKRERSRLPSKGAWVLGCCATDPEIVIGELLKHPTSIDLLEWVRSGLILFSPAQSRSEPKLGKKPDRAPFLAPAIKGAAREYLGRSIQQALAGPPLKQSKAWVGRRVIDWVDLLFRDHLNDENRVEVRRVRGTTSMERAPELVDRARSRSDNKDDGDDEDESEEDKESGEETDEEEE